MADKERWITLKSGKRILLDKTGKVIKGFHGFIGKHVSKLGEYTEIRKFTTPEKNLSQYINENKDTLIGAEKYLEENIKDTYIKTKIKGIDVDILFTAKTIDHFKSDLMTNRKLRYFVDELPNILKEKPRPEEGGKKKRNDFSAFYFFEKEIEKPVPKMKKGQIVFENTKAKIHIHVGVRTDSKRTYEAYSIGQDKKTGYIQSYAEAFHACHDPPTHQECSHDSQIYQHGEVVNINIEILEDTPMNKKSTITFDSKSKRSFDKNGFMHVECSNISKESVDPYYSYEIANSEALGFEPDKIYFGYRKGEELAKAAKTFNGLPLMQQRPSTDCRLCGNTILTVHKIHSVSSGLDL